MHTCKFNGLGRWERWLTHMASEQLLVIRVKAYLKTGFDNWRFAWWRKTVENRDRCFWY